MIPARLHKRLAQRLADRLRGPFFRTLAMAAAVMAQPLNAEEFAHERIQAVLNNRCVVCHGCYDGPCQLKLSSPDGWARGASKERVYESSRLEDAPLTRLGIDATTVEGWREKGFFSVTGTENGPSIMEQLLEAGRRNPFEPAAPLPDSISLDVNRTLACPAPGEISAYLESHPHGGMPYAIAGLPDPDYEALLAWARAGAPAGEAAPPLPTQIQQQVLEVEDFFNRPDIKSQLSSRYIYEHLFLGHLHLEGDEPGRFFRLIRSRTASGTPPEEIATRRPFDAPGDALFYRLIPINGTILHKEHNVYEIGPERLARYQELFSDANWSASSLPPYSEDAGGNPLSTFKDIPVRSRYQFLLDDALFFVRSFIRGPVCYGQVAVNVIQDRFWVSFLDPNADLSVTDPQYLEDAMSILELPVAKSDGTITERLESYIDLGPIKYQDYRQERYAEAAQQTGGLTYADIWDGDGVNTGARLTIFRNFSSASVVRGFVGAIPDTAWVIDYPLFERIYYNLVAGFDVFGNVEHQLTTRLYMDSLRREGERMFLSFMPPDRREPLHDGWYRGVLVNLVDRWKEAPLDTTTPTGVSFQTSDPKSEFLTHLLEQPPRLWPVTDPLNRCSGDTCAAPGTPAGQLRALSQTPAPFARYMPDIAVLVVDTAGGPEIFTLVHDMAHSNVAFVFNEDLRREPEKDGLTVVADQFGSYPNFIFKVDEAELPAFVASVEAVRNQRTLQSLVDKFGIRRTHPDFWTVFDGVQAAMNAQNSLEAGLLDLNRYIDPKITDPIERLFGFTFRED